MSPPKPLVAIVGRPNVGKSTLANRIVGRRAAVVQEKPGVTRDRREFPAEWNGRSFTVIDTGGWQQGKDADLIEDIRIQAETAVAGADLILFVVDAQGGITSDDAAVARLLRPETDSVVVVANKADNDTLSRESGAFTRLGLGEPLPVSAIHGHGVADLLDVLIQRLPDPHDGDIVEDPVPEVAVIGRPNVGKSTLLNRLVGDERVLVSPVPGTTRDPIDVMIELDGAEYRLIDTAGMRRKPKMSEDVEFFSVLRAREVLQRAHAALLMVDAADGVTHQDQRIARLAADSGAALVILANKWDAADLERREQTTYELGARLGFAGWAPVLRISALTGARLHRLGPALETVLENRSRRIPTAVLNRLITELAAEHPPPMRKGRRPRILFAAQSRSVPPTIALFVKGGTLDSTYLRFLERRLRQIYDFTGTPVRMVVRRGAGRARGR
ncbi:MAG: ribosome biogenesis GTPase Der [Acidimicrobiia bacterium]|nr:ribosome biogenesis GTPase Der [Acidimicrobiia bacterium]